MSYMCENLFYKPFFRLRKFNLLFKLFQECNYFLTISIRVFAGPEKQTTI